MKKIHLLTCFLLLCVAPIKNMETRLVKLVPIDNNGEKIKNGPLIPYNVALQSTTFKTMTEDAKNDPQKKTIPFFIQNCSCETAQNLSECLRIENPGIRDKKQHLPLFLDKLSTNQLVDIINAIDFINIPSLQKKLITHLCKKQSNDRSFTANLTLLKQGPQNLILTKLLKQKNYAKQIIEDHIQSNKAINPIDTNQHPTNFTSLLLPHIRPYPTFAPCYFNNITKTIIFLDKRNVSDSKLIIQKPSQDDVIIDITQSNIYKILHISANNDETLLHIQGLAENNNMATYYIANIPQQKLIPIQPNQLTCIIKNNPQGFYYVNNRANTHGNRNILKDNGGVCIAEDLVKDNNITSLSCNDDGNVIALCSANKIFTITKHKDNDFYEEIDMSSINFSVINNNKIKQILSISLNHTGNKLLVIIAKNGTDINNQFYLSSLWLIDLKTSKTKKISLQKNISLNFLQSKFTDDNRFIILSDYKDIWFSPEGIIIFSYNENTYYCYDLRTKIFFEKCRQPYPLTTNSKEVIVETADEEFATQEIINTDTEKLIHCFNKLNQNPEQKLTLFNTMQPKLLKQKILSAIKQHPYLTMASFLLLPFIIKNFTA